MLLFAADVTIGYLDCRMADVLAFASIWTLQMREPVRVCSIYDSLGRRMPFADPRFDSAIVLAIEREDAGALDRLAFYLTETLGPRFTVRLVEGRLHVEWYMHYAGLERGVWA